MKFEPNKNEQEALKSIGGINEYRDMNLEAFEHIKLHFYFIPLQPRSEIELGNIIIKWKRALTGSPDEISRLKDDE